MVSRVGFRWTWEGEGRRLCAGLASVVAAYAGKPSMAGFAVRLVALPGAGFMGESMKINGL
jgi:hypothetical protein